jgi:NAD(P)-dependent dehydrogenase (short-subunit alcohol dehydrogenase family)
MTGTRNQTLALCCAGLGAAVAVRAWRKARALDFSGKSVVIFGGSRGLGLVIARELAAEGARLMLVARNTDELDRAWHELEDRGATVATVACDIRERQQVNHAISEAVARYGGIDVLINDAGIIQVGPLDHMTLEDFENAMATHFWGPLHAILAARPHLRESAAARIVNISSIGGKVAVPHLLTYTASKFALTGLSEGLSAELSREGIHVTTVCPGLMRTGSTYNAWFKGNHRREFAWFHLADSMPGLSTDARRAARQVIEACRRAEPELVITMPARLAVVINALFPNAVARAMRIVNALLPSPDPTADLESRSGWQSVSGLTPSMLTRRTDRATRENNEMPGTGMPRLA